MNEEEHRESSVVTQSDWLTGSSQQKNEEISSIHRYRICNIIVHNLQKYFPKLLLNVFSGSCRQQFSHKIV